MTERNRDRGRPRSDRETGLSMRCVDCGRPFRSYGPEHTNDTHCDPCQERRLRRRQSESLDPLGAVVDAEVDYRDYYDLEGNERD